MRKKVLWHYLRKLVHLVGRFLQHDGCVDQLQVDLLVPDPAAFLVLVIHQHVEQSERLSVGVLLEQHPQRGDANQVRRRPEPTQLPAEAADSVLGQDIRPEPEISVLEESTFVAMKRPVGASLVAHREATACCKKLFK